MGAGSSTHQVQEHLDKQEACIKKIQQALEKQGGSGWCMGFEEGEPEDGASVVSDYEDELEVAHMAARVGQKVTPDNTVDADEAKIPDHEWKPPTEEERETLKYAKPWLLEMIPPTNPPSEPASIRDQAPTVKPVLEYVYGYRTRCARNTLATVSDREVVYCAAGVGIVHDRATNKQRFFTGHTDEVLCVGFHAGKNLVATGQIGCPAVLCVWDVATLEQKAKLADAHSSAFTAVAFSEDGSVIGAVSVHDWTYRVALFDWEKGQKIGVCTTGSRALFGLGFVPGTKSEFVTHGVKHISFWQYSPDAKADEALTQAPALLGKKGKMQGFMCIEFIDARVVAGTAGGELYLFNKQRQLIAICYAHSGCVTSVVKTGDKLVSGGSDGYLHVWGSDFTKSASIAMNDKENPVVNSVRALAAPSDPASQVLLVGCVNASIYAVDLTDATKTKEIAFHSGDLTEKGRYGELWAVCEDPSANRFATVCDDAILRIWDSETHACVYSGSIGVQSAGGPARCLAWSPDGKWLAAGFLQGSVAVFSTTDGKLGLSATEEARFRVRKRRVQTLRFSPCSKYLALGGADNFVDVFEAGTCAKVCECKGNTGVILSVDWSVDSKYVRTSAQDYVMRFFEVPSGACVSGEATRDIEWSTVTSFLGWDVQGIWPKCSDGSDINALSRSHDGKLLATADQYGTLKLFRYPCIGSGLNAEGRLLRRPACSEGNGQACVTNVAWNHKDSRLWTSGGEDLTIFQWMLVSC
ncbi:77 kDa echinoderm microtubule-associated protein [Diplonema papillatum]|nr:77 kDa echinoderm microtubule-associated protein [Diplonema papillatum]